ncbi:hypothetical protein [Yersinia intermedia]|uniref:hypothetical protein n=1 Tax=Yersinia intermedia TaxID=631 RepID=UPI0005E8B1D9|nr:hypothetical protein [Yersinia intermedia]CNE43773.1 Uncharacterised protein [Yersinia intermedia]
MTLEKRIEELESEVSSLKEVVTSLVGGDFSIKEGEVFINDTYIRSGSIKTAISQAAYSMSVGINRA